MMGEYVDASNPMTSSSSSSTSSLSSIHEQQQQEHQSVVLSTTSNDQRLPHELIDQSIAKRKAYDDAATCARQNRRRKVQILRQKREQQQHHQQHQQLVEQRQMEATTSANENHNICNTTSNDSGENQIYLSDVPSMREPSTMKVSSTILHPFSLLDRRSESSNTSLLPLHMRVQERYQSNSNIVTIIPDVKGVQEICYRLHESKECVAIPTECTYESIYSFPPVGTVPLTSSGSTKPTKYPPHVYIPNVSIFDTCQFWKQQLPKKSYGIRQVQSSSPVVIATFNESVHVLRRLSTKYWPGPVVIYIQVQQPIPGLSITTHAVTKSETKNEVVSYTSESKVQHYIAIRKPCHPLSQKVCNEFYSQLTSTTSYRQHSNSNSSSYTSSCNTTPSASPVITATTMDPSTSMSLSLSSPFMITPCHVSSTVSVSTSMLESSSSDENTLISQDNNNMSSEEVMSTTTPPQKSRTISKVNVLNQGQDQVDGVPTSRPQPAVLLVGTPMIFSKKKNHKHHFDKKSLQERNRECNCIEYVHTADRVLNTSNKVNDPNKKISAVLHGEEKYEILSVPTCMYQQPFPTSIWIDSDTRTVRIKDSCSKQVECEYHHHSNMSSPDNLHQNQQQHLIDEASILQSIRALPRSKSISPIVFPQQHTSTTTTTTTRSNATTPVLSPKERVLHAVLLKWKVVTE